MALYNLPVLTGANLVDPALERDQDPPEAWTAASAALDAAPEGYRLWQLPGAEFGAFRWGYTVDPPPPGLTNRPLVTRDLLPLGSAGAMDLAYAMDDRFQAGVAEVDAVAPVARLLGADTVWLTGDAAFDRFRTARPEVTEALFGPGSAGSAPDLGEPVPYGTPQMNAPDVPMIDEQSLSDPRIGQPVPPVELVPVNEPVPVIRAKDREVVVAGSGDGVIDAAAADVLEGTELLRYAASLTEDELAEALRTARRAVVTDSNRDRAHHWRGSQDVWGFTESGGPGTDVLDPDDSDERLPVFPDAPDRAAAQTVALQEGPVRATASAYGEPFAYRPEDRAVMAVDGDPTTAWRVADRAPAEGHRIRLEVDEPIDHVTLRQPSGAAAVRHIGAVTIAVDDREPVRVELDESSLSDGQRIDLEPTSGPSTVTITIDSVVVPDLTPGPASAAVGFSEIDFGLGPTVEVVRVPTDLTTALAAEGEDGPPLSYVLTRLRTRPTDRWRSDPEPAMVREIEVPVTQRFTPEITVRLDQRADDAVLAELLGIEGAQASARLTGVAGAAGWAATDGDPATAWITPFGQAVGARLQATLEAPVTELTITQRTGGDTSPITGLRLTAGATPMDVAVPPPDESGQSRIPLPEPLPAGPVEIEITAIEPRTTIDRRFGEPVVLPAAITELSVGPPTSIPSELASGCRDDLITIGGEPFPVRIEGTPAQLLAGEAVRAEPCDESALLLDAGTHRIETTPGAQTGLQVDRIVLDVPGPDQGGFAPFPLATVTSSDRLDRTVTVDGCPDGCWLVLGEGFHDSWSARTDQGDLGPPTMVDGGFNGWWIPPADGPTVVTVEWTSQRPLTIALALSIIAVVACIVIAVLDRRRRPEGPRVRPARFEFPGRPAARPALVAGAAVWIVAAGLLVGPAWALVAAAGSAVLLALARRPRLAGLVTLGALAFIAAAIIWIQRTAAHRGQRRLAGPLRSGPQPGALRRRVAPARSRRLAPAPGPTPAARRSPAGRSTVSGRRGWLVPTVALALAALPIVVAVVRTLSGGWMAIGDNGLILLRAEDVATAHHPLLGTWTSASQAAGRTISNPGPLWFDVLAPFVKVAGPSVGLAVGGHGGQPGRHRRSGVGGATGRRAAGHGPDDGALRRPGLEHGERAAVRSLAAPRHAAAVLVPPGDVLGAGRRRPPHGPVRGRHRQPARPDPPELRVRRGHHRRGDRGDDRCRPGAHGSRGRRDLGRRAVVAAPHRLWTAGVAVLAWCQPLVGPVLR